MTIGDSPLSSLFPLVYLLPLHYSSHIHPPHTHHNLLFPFPLWRDTKTLLHTSTEVSNSDCPLWSHTSPEQSIFILPAVRLFSATVSVSSGLLLLLLAYMPWWKCAKMAVGGGSGDLRTENGTDIKAVELEEQKAGRWVCCNLYMHSCNQ